MTRAQEICSTDADAQILGIYACRLHLVCHIVNDKGYRYHREAVQMEAAAIPEEHCGNTHIQSDPEYDEIHMMIELVLCYEDIAEQIHKNRRDTEIYERFEFADHEKCRKSKDQQQYKAVDKVG